MAAAFAVTITLGFLLYDGGLPQSVESQLSVSAADVPKPFLANDTLADGNP